MEYNNLEIKKESSISRGVIYFSITLLLLLVALFGYFYYTQVFQRNTNSSADLSPITQEDIDAIISLEPASDPDTALSPDQIDAIIEAEANYSNSDSQELTAEQILKIQQAN